VIVTMTGVSGVRGGVVRSWRAAVLGGAVCAGLVVGGVSPSWAGAEAGGEAGSAVVGPFGLGVGVQGTVDERSGAFSFEVPLGGISLGWDSRGPGDDGSGFGFGPRWSLAGVGFIDTRGGVRVMPSRSAQGAFAADASAPSGLAGYVGDDVRFSQTPGVLPAREDGAAGERAYAFVLRELGGLVSYFDAAGDPVAKLDVHGGRVDWEWGPGHRLREVVTETGVVTELDWSDPGLVAVQVRAGADGVVRPVGTVELDGGRLSAVVDATGARTTVRYAPSGLVERVGAASGAVTDVVWQGLPDGSVVVERVTVTDPETGERVVERRWEAVAGLPSGWPAQSGAGAGGFGSARFGPGAEFRTAVTDGVTRVVSAYTGAQVMAARDTAMTTPSGERVLQQQRFTFPDLDDEVPGRVDRPTGMDLTHIDVAGGTKTVSEGYVFDAYGRIVERTAADGTVTFTAFDGDVGDDPDVPEEFRVPVGLPVLERTQAPDGSVTESRYTLNEARTSVSAVETFTGVAGQELTRTGRSEFVVEADGFVSAERVFGQGGEGDPLVTDHARSVDLGAGTVTTTDTVAAGTDLAGTTTRVWDAMHGQPIAVVDVLGREATMEYDVAGRPIVATDPVGRSTRIEYRSRQQDGVNATVTTRPDLVVQTEEYDVVGRATRNLDNVRDGVATEGHARVAETREYPSVGTMRVTDAWGWASTTEQDPFGRVTRATVSSGLSQVSKVNEVAGTQSMGFTMTGDLADAELVTTQQVDLNGRVTETSGVRADGLPVARSVAVYDGFGRQTRSSDGVADASVEFDAYGNPVTTTVGAAAGDDEHAGAGAGAAGDPLVATRRFDARGTSVEKTLTVGDETRTGGVREQDLLGREVVVTDQAGDVTWNEYTPDGLLARQVTSAGMDTVHTHDPVTRELVKTVTTSPVGDAVATGYGYDELTGRVVAVFDPADPEHTTIRYAYDAWGNPTEIAYPDGRSIRHGYDAHGRKTHTIDVTGAKTAYEHDASGLVTRVVQHNAQGEPTGSVTYRYDDFGRVIGLDRGNGVRTEVTFTSASEIATETTTGADGRIQSERLYAYDTNGNLTTRTDTVTDPDTGEASTSTTAYAYDLHHRLVSSVVHDGDSIEGTVQTRTEYTVNVASEITREQVITTSTDSADQQAQAEPAEQVRTREFEYSPTGQLSRITTTEPDGRNETVAQEYDVAGNLTLAADGTRYAYNARNRAVQEITADGATIRIGYWASGDRATLTTGEHVTGFYWDDGTLLNDIHTDASATQTGSYLIGVTREARTLTPDLAGRVASDEGAGVSRPTTTYAVHDRHGSTTELTNPTGTTSTRFAYTDYGTTTTIHAGSERKPESADDEASRYPFLYAGEYTNPSGTQHLAVRTYAPDVFGFTSLDTVPLQNRYGYADANPITKIDPSGHFSLQDVINGLTIGVGVLFAAVTVVGGILGMAAASSVIGFIAANAASFAFGSLSVLAGVAGSTIATLRFVHEHESEFLAEDVDQQLMYSEYALMGFGALTAGLSVITAPKTLAKLSAAFRPRPAARGQAGSTSYMSTSYTQVGSGQVDPTLTGKVDAASAGAATKLKDDNQLSSFIRGYRKTIKNMKASDAYAQIDAMEGAASTQAHSLLRKAELQLDELTDAYHAASKTWKDPKLPNSSEMGAYVTANKSTMKQVISDIDDARWAALELIPGMEFDMQMSLAVAATRPDKYTVGFVMVWLY
jgi:RHS repeat-associated protein